MNGNVKMKSMAKAVDRERVTRYRKSYPLDKHTDAEILLELNTVHKEKKELDKWIERQANINLQYVFNGYKIFKDTKVPE